MAPVPMKPAPTILLLFVLPLLFALLLLLVVISFITAIVMNNEVDYAPFAPEKVDLDVECKFWVFWLPPEDA